MIRDEVRGNEWGGVQIVGGQHDQKDYEKPLEEVI